MNCIHGKKVDKITETNLLHDTINSPKRNKYLNSHYSPIIHGCINTRNVKAKFKNFRILLDSGCSYKIIMGRLIQKLNPQEGDLMQWHTQAGSITTNLKVKIDFTFPEISATKIVTWNCHADAS